MAKEISENTVVGLSLKTIGGIVAGVAVVTIGYFDLKAEIELAKELPPPEVGRMEYDLKDQLVRETIMNTQKDVEEIKVSLNKIEERLLMLQGDEVFCSFYIISHIKPNKNISNWGKGLAVVQYNAEFNKSNSVKIYKEFPMLVYLMLG